MDWLQPPDLYATVEAPVARSYTQRQLEIWESQRSRLLAEIEHMQADVAELNLRIRGLRAQTVDP